jgi:hypothetical protein
VARATEDYQILRPLVAVVLVAAMMKVKRRVAGRAGLALVFGSHERLRPLHLPLRFLSVFGSHLVQLGSPCLLSEASYTALLVVLMQPELGACPAQQSRRDHLPYMAVADHFQFALEAARVVRALRVYLLLAREAPEEEYRLRLGDGPRFSAIDSERVVQPGDGDLV